ncbi:hypothetical protein MLD38_025321 [Melastoma candidum]|uniref:Uncharacterized protein n=1 Tax=Melastoma candidum TaxID=119954 RepID=A0ACB9NVH8_9MYRT|nr:hypothetical protein MLD38_025321 [Melastoma candidum]
MCKHSVSSGLSSWLVRACLDYDSDLASLWRKLVKLTISRSTIQSTDIKLENLCLLTLPLTVSGNLFWFSGLGHEYDEAARLRQEKVLRAIKAMNEIEDMLIDIAKSQSKPPTEVVHIGSGIPNRLILMHANKREDYAHSFLALCALRHPQARR